MRLIDADRLKEVLDRNFYGFGWDDVAKQLIDAQPTIEIIKHGYWKFYPDEECHIICSKCGKEYYCNKQETPNYCPNCGIKMAEEIEDKNIKVPKVKYGYWKLRRIGKGYIRECSECHTWPNNLSDKDLQYCKNCGAKMAEEKT